MEKYGINPIIFPILQHSNTPTSSLSIPNPLPDFRIPPSAFRLALPLVRIQDIPKAVTHQIKAHDDD